MHQERTIRDRPGDSLERIVPFELAHCGATGRATYDFHIERYKFAARHLKGSTVLDIACGVGYGTSFLMNSCEQLKFAHGVDISEEAIRYAREHYAHQNIHYACDDGMRFRGLGAYDSIVSLETIEHVLDPVAFLLHMSSLLRPGGALITSVPTTPSMDGNPHHLTDFTEKSFRELGQGIGLREIVSLRQEQKFGFRSVVQNRERRLERTPHELLRFYAMHPSKLVWRLWALARFGFVNKYLTIVWEKAC